jgi:hypothetical protein
VDVKLEGGKEVILPGEVSTLYFLITNTGPDLYNVELSWEGENDFIIPIGTDNRKLVDMLESGSEVELPFEVVAKSSLDYGTYPLTYSIQYLDPNSAQRSLSAKTGIIVGGGTELEVSFQGGGTTETSFSITNVGVNPAQSLMVEIPDQPGFKVTGGSSSTVGNLNPGDFTLVSFYLTPTGRSENQGVSVLLKYTDTLGNRQVVEKTVKIPASGFQKGESYLDEKSTGRKVGLGDIITNPIFIITLVVVVACPTAFLYMRRKKKRNEHP